jgi:hypothetical protein
LLTVFNQQFVDAKHQDALRLARFTGSSAAIAGEMIAKRSGRWWFL